MPCYELDGRKMSAKLQRQLASLPMEIVFDSETGRVLARADKKLPRGKGVREIPDADFARQDEAAGAGVAKRAVVRGGVRLESSSAWRVGPDSPREARLHWVAIGGDEQALAVALGEGRGDRVEIVCPVRATTDLTGVSLEVKPTLDSGDHLAVGVTLTSATERPWLEREPQPAAPNAWTALAYDFADVDRRKVERADRLVIALHTDADEGVCLIRDLCLLR